MTDENQPLPEPSEPKKLVRSPTRTEVLGVSGASLLFLLGWFAEQGLSMAKDHFFPDANQLRAQAVRAELSRKTEEIKGLADSMAMDLAGLRQGSGNPEALESFLVKAEQLMQRTEGLQPAVTHASNFSKEMASAVAASKAAEIDRLGYSGRADIRIANNDGFAFCKERFSFGVSEWYSSNKVEARISYRDETNFNGHMEPGEALSVVSGSTKATVTYIGPVGEGDDLRLGFNLACDPIEDV